MHAAMTEAEEPMAAGELGEMASQLAAAEDEPEQAQNRPSSGQDDAAGEDGPQQDAGGEAAGGEAAAEALSEASRRVR